MDVKLLLLIPALLIPFTGWAQHPYAAASKSMQASPARTSSNSSPSPSTHYQAAPATTQVSKAVRYQSNPSPSSFSTSQQRLGDRHPSYGKSNFSSTQNTINEAPGLIIIKARGPEKIITNTMQSPQLAPKNSPLDIPATSTITDNTTVLCGQRLPVVFFRHDNRECHFNTSRLYGVQIGYYKSYQEAKKDLKKFKSHFKVAGFVCEDWNVSDNPYRLILGRYSQKTNVIKLLQKTRHVFPFSFIVKYA